MKIEEKVIEIEKLTKDNKLVWEPTSRMAMFGTFMNESFVCIDQRTFSDESYEITIFNQAGDIDDRKTYYDSDRGFEGVKSLYMSIVQNDPLLQSKYDEAKRLYMEEEQRKEKVIHI